MTGELKLSFGAILPFCKKQWDVSYDLISSMTTGRQRYYCDLTEFVCTSCPSTSVLSYTNCKRFCILFFFSVQNLSHPTHVMNSRLLVKNVTLFLLFQDTSSSSYFLCISVSLVVVTRLYSISFL